MRAGSTLKTITLSLSLFLVVSSLVAADQPGNKQTLNEVNTTNLETKLEGLTKALEHLDSVITVIRSAKSPAEAKEQLQNHFEFTPIQAQAILEMRLQRLTGLERDKILEEYQAVTKKIAELEELKDKKLAELAELAELKEILEKKTIQKETPPKEKTRAYWKDTLRLEDGTVKLKVGGRIQVDWLWINKDKTIRSFLNQSAPDRSAFRRVRFYLSGTIFQAVDFKVQVEPDIGGDLNPKDIHFGFKRIPGIGQLKIGHFKEPFSLEALTSSNHITFMERSLSELFTPSRNVGAAVSNTLLDERLTWSAGVFRDSDGVSDSRMEGNFHPLRMERWASTFRVTGLPWYRKAGTCRSCGEKALHLGFAYSERRANSDNLIFNSQPTGRLQDGLTMLRPPLADYYPSFPSFLDRLLLNTGIFDASKTSQVGLEGALLLGPLSVQSEYLRTHVQSQSVRNPTFNGFYVYGSLFLTGENRPYKRSSGTFGLVRPKNNPYGSNRGLGAWEIAVRYSNLDLATEHIRGEQLSNFTTGLNWYWSPNGRLLFNYVLGDLAECGCHGAGASVNVGNAHTFMSRIQLNF